MAELKDSESEFDDEHRILRPTTKITDENVEAIEQVVLRDRHISIRRGAEELGISKSTTPVHQSCSLLSGASARE